MMTILTGLIALFTLMLFVVTLWLVIVGALQWLTYKDTLATHREIERAYISMSHEAVVLADSTRKVTVSSRHRTDDENPDAVELVVTIKNHGRTPGDVLGGFWGFIYQPANVGPNLARVFNGGRLTRLFLLPGATIDFTAVAQLGREEMTKLVREEWSADAEYLWFVGEVDYRDRFDKIHRCGYGRRYDKDAAGFVFGPETGPRNYDRPLTEDEIRQRAYENTEGQSRKQQVQPR